MVKLPATATVAGLLFFGAQGLALAAHAQQASPAPARDLAGLYRMARYGDTVVVTSVSGEVLRGTLAQVMVDRDAVAVEVGELRLELPARGIRTIDIKEDDPRVDGALKGALYGLGVTVILALMSKEDGGGGDSAAMAVFTVPLGAFFGAYVDSAHHARRTIYRGPGYRRPSTPTVSDAGRMATRIAPRAFAVRIVW